MSGGLRRVRLPMPSLFYLGLAQEDSHEQSQRRLSIHGAPQQVSCCPPVLPKAKQKPNIPNTKQGGGRERVFTQMSKHDHQTQDDHPKAGPKRGKMFLCRDAYRLSQAKIQVLKILNQVGKTSVTQSSKQLKKDRTYTNRHNKLMINLFT